jgi:hypothetical protein
LTAITPSPARNPLAIQLVSFFDTIQGLFKVSASANLSYSGFEVIFSNDWNAWTKFYVRWAEDCRVFEVITAPANAVLHRFIKDLARVTYLWTLRRCCSGEEDAAV